jgi:nicotinate-nucleotide adenylyltransferase
MVRLAIAAAKPHFRLCLHEFEREGVSYTYNTAQELIRRYPGHRFSWIIGADMVRFLPQWHNIDELVKIVSFIGLPRPGYAPAEADLPEAIRAAVRMTDMPAVDISSTAIRNMAARGRSFRFLVPEAVYEYIRENRLYAT